jgi:hypothetical protein
MKALAILALAMFLEAGFLATAAIPARPVAPAVSAGAVAAAPDCCPPHS